MISMYTNFQYFLVYKKVSLIFEDKLMFYRNFQVLRLLKDSKNCRKTQKFPKTGLGVLDICIYLRFFMKKKTFDLHPNFLCVLTCKQPRALPKLWLVEVAAKNSPW